MKEKNKDNRPDPKPRKHPQLWQSYQLYNELVEQRKRHTLRLSSIDKGKSNMDRDIHIALWTMNVGTKSNPLAYCDVIDRAIKITEKEMINWGKMIPIWDYITNIKGLKSGSLTARVLAQIDDIGKFDTVSKLWRFAGYGVINGRAESGTPNYNRILKTTLYLVSEQFIRQQTPVYIDKYYAERERLRAIHPEKIVIDGKTKYNDGHLHNMSRRKMIKIFLQHLYVSWRVFEGLPVRSPYVHEYLHHTTYITPNQAGWGLPFDVTLEGVVDR